jgi:hypothetical protein
MLTRVLSIATIGVALLSAPSLNGQTRRTLQPEDLITDGERYLQRERDLQERKLPPTPIKPSTTTSRISGPPKVQ